MNFFPFRERFLPQTRTGCLTHSDGIFHKLVLAQEGIKNDESANVCFSCVEAANTSSQDFFLARGFGELTDAEEMLIAFMIPHIMVIALRSEVVKKTSSSSIASSRSYPSGIHGEHLSLKSLKQEWMISGMCLGRLISETGCLNIYPSHKYICM
ncbi:hypothetical protein BC829DRAFT_381405 [Chytridium lagenaria]|nr:hypothetical protein BC829DRAFT_381405 [Chytridium lagenaria]